MRITWFSVAGLSLVIMARPVQAQGNDASIPAGSAVGVTVDRFYFGPGNHFYAATVHISALKPNNLSSEFAIALFPQALAARVILTNIDVGGAINIPIHRATLLLRGGGSGLFALGAGARLALPAAHYGASLLIKTGEKDGIRLDVLRRVYFRQYEDSYPSLTIGVGFTSLPGLN
jgi:hypothetical protein